MGLKWETKEKKKGGFSKGILVFMLMFLFLFTVSNLILFYYTGSEPSTLISCVFAFCSAEGGFLAWVKYTKTKNKNRKDDLEC